MLRRNVCITPARKKAGTREPEPRLHKGVFAMKSVLSLGLLHVGGSPRIHAGEERFAFLRPDALVGAALRNGRQLSLAL